MSQIKRLLELQEAQHAAAIEILVAVGVLRRCEYHSDIVLEANSVDIQAAYKLGNWKFTRHEFDGVFATRDEMEDAIKAAENEHGLDSCPLCDKLLED